MQHIVSYRNIPIEAQGSAPIDPHQVVTMTVIVQNGELYASINGQQVISLADNLGTSPGDVGLLVERQNAAPSSLIQYSNFELDMAS